MRRPLLVLSLLGCWWGGPAWSATPPMQPESGPGGSDYVSEDVVKMAVGRAGAPTFVFHAADEGGDKRPVVVFLHSWGAANPQFYGGWIEHIARKGHLVLFPRFQEVNRTRPADATDIAATLVKDALAALAEDPAARPDASRIALIGHLAGVPLAMNLAAKAKEMDMPAPKLIFGVMPGGIASTEKDRGILLGDLSAIDASTLIIAMSGDRDYLPSDRAARRLFEAASAVPATRKLFMRVGSDDHGFPTLTATLASPGSPKAAYDAAAIKLPPDPPRDPKQRSTWRWTADMALTGPQTIITQQLGNNGTDALDYRAYWKTFDMAAEAAFSDKDAAALARNPKFIDMGAWSDGWPVRRMSAQMPKDAGREEAKPERGPRRRLD
jgi:dienelactone hydrolase